MAILKYFHIYLTKRWSNDSVFTIETHDDVITTLCELLALCEGNPSAIGGFPSQRTSNACLNVFFDVKLNKPNKMSSCQWLKTPCRSCDVTVIIGVTNSGAIDAFIDNTFKQTFSDTPHLYEYKMRQ